MNSRPERDPGYSAATAPTGVRSAIDGRLGRARQGFRSFTGWRTTAGLCTSTIQFLLRPCAERLFTTTLRTPASPHTSASGRSLGSPSSLSIHAAKYSGFDLCLVPFLFFSFLYLPLFPSLLFLTVPPYSSSRRVSLFLVVCPSLRTRCLAWALLACQYFITLCCCYLIIYLVATAAVYPSSPPTPYV